MPVFSPLCSLQGAAGTDHARHRIKYHTELDGIYISSRYRMGGFVAITEVCRGAASTGDPPHGTKRCFESDFTFNPAPGDQVEGLLLLTRAARGRYRLGLRHVRGSDPSPLLPNPQTRTP